ncbi:hypothetical protein BHF68_00465 [Desulfuribacillus alkaliarsenatis]|uniref:Calcineurin-like phosphoesterase domain-containing protein n=2 Tax=Desulfuribacillus alkaliarsenatis TaxID=766136 RepID=A0A1E5G6E6_9FIRM|nr:hypothetical protein BHF68_00465 [Desulfuribacillus alkaliarsenatis]
MFIISFILSYGYWNTFRPILQEVDVDLPGCTENVCGMRILHLSDMHMERISVSPEKMYEQIKGTNPDMIVLTGDYLDEPGNLPKWAVYMQYIARLQPKYGMYAVLGNHDYRLGDKVNELIAIMESYNCKVLQNESIQINYKGKDINIIGIDDYHLRRSNLELAYANIDERALSIVITHDPNIILHMDGRHKVDYLLAGHFHGGQCDFPYAFRLYPMGVLPKQNLYKGLLDYKGKRMYISAGLGQSAINVRYNSRPEITLHRLQAE